MKFEVSHRIYAPLAGSRFHWLHTSHGPFPQLAAVYTQIDTNEQFTVAVWDAYRHQNRYWICAVEAHGPSIYHAGILHSYLWRNFAHEAHCTSEKRRRIVIPLEPSTHPEYHLWTVSDNSLLLYVS